jgi:exodeoxyribonuclease V gamma subunit
MLFLYQSNRLEVLGQFFAAMSAAAPLADPFTAESVIVQSRGMGRWLTQTLATEAGVAANLDYALPAAFAWRLMRTVLPELPAKSGFAPEVLTWRLMEWLPQLKGEPFAPLERYLEGGERAAFELAGKVADIFDQYLVFRPSWIRAWEAGKLVGLGDDEAWQAELWRRLAADDPGRHRVRMLDEVLAGLKREHVPERVTLFGIASLAPMYLALVKRLAELTDVCFFALSPCQEAWGDIVDARGQLALFGGEEEQGVDGHPLLASLGKQGRDFFDLLVAECANELTPLFVEPDGATLLSRLQRDLLNLTPPGAEPQALEAHDHSVEVHATHGAMREVEVLKDRLLSMFAADPSLTPADIAVLTPDINAYAPYIDAVFARREDAPSIPYTLADRQLTREHPLLASVAALLQLADSRFAAEAVLALFDCPALLRRFELAEDDLPFLRDWLRASGIRWGRDAAHKASLGLPAEPRFTWRWGLDRLLLGAVLPDELAGQGEARFAGLLPAGVAQGQWAEVLARFASAIGTLLRLAEEWETPASPAGWAERLRQAADALFLPGDNDEAALDILRTALAELEGDAALAAFAGRIGLPVLRDWLTRKLTLAGHSGFLAGSVTFCAMVPMRSLPFKVIGLIGMNDGAYPRDERPVSFDLIARHPARGDRSRRFDDRYLFLEALLSARQRLYLSYVGRSARSDEPLPPSPLVAELLDTFEKMAGPGLKQQLLIEHPLQPFSPRAYPAEPADPRASFEPLYAAALAAPAREAAPFASALALTPPPLLRFEAFTRFWRHPARAWLTERLGLRLYRHEEQLPEAEPFALDRDGTQAIESAQIGALLQGRSLTPLAGRIDGAGLTPSGALGGAWLEAATDASRRFAARLPAALTEPALAPQSFSLELDGHTLLGEFSGLRAQGKLGFVARASFVGERIQWWLEHLALCAAAPDGITPRSIWYAREAVFDFAPLPRATALAELAPWLAFYLEGQLAPLPFLPRTSWAYAEALAKHPGATDKALHAAQAKWAPAYVGEGGLPQSQEPEVRLAFRSQEPLLDPRFTHLAETLLLPLLAHLAQAHEEDQ